MVAPPIAGQYRSPPGRPWRRTGHWETLAKEADIVHTDEQSGRRGRPTKEETFAAAVELASGGSSAFRRFARRYSLCSADADDAYQRSLEILLTKAPTADRGELRAW